MKIDPIIGLEASVSENFKDFSAVPAARRQRTQKNAETPLEAIQ